ncbi:MAG: ABC transporter ATP-binding protein [Alphaproteobacteria bacterium]|nr:ABC transporter ATP-binding protein [Alphaproteobacteria bacterium]
MPLLAIDKLEVRYGPIYGTHEVSLTLEPGETVALVGSNGAGKSSTLKAIMGIAPVAKGAITLEGKSLLGLRPSDIVRQGIGYSPEGRRVFPYLSVRDNLEVGGFVTDKATVGARMEQVFGYFPRLRERATQRAGSLSGGEQQMLAIGRALMSRPRIFLLDEPSLGLAPVIVERIGEIIAEIQKTEQLAVILAEQNAVWALSIARRAAILELGRVVAEGSAETLRADPQVQRAYLGIA